MPSISDIIKPVRIERDAVYIGGQKLPGAIEEDGVIVRPGGHKSLNRLTVTFIVGDVEVVDPTGYSGASPLETP